MSAAVALGNKIMEAGGEGSTTHVGRSGRDAHCWCIGTGAFLC